MYEDIADLVFDYGIPEVIRKITHYGHAPFLLVGLCLAGVLRQELELILDRLEGSELRLARITTCAERGRHTQIGFSVAQSQQRSSLRFRQLRTGLTVRG